MKTKPTMGASVILPEMKQKKRIEVSERTAKFIEALESLDNAWVAYYDGLELLKGMDGAEKEMEQGFTYHIGRVNEIVKKSMNEGIEKNLNNLEIFEI